MARYMLKNGLEGYDGTLYALIDTCTGALVRNITPAQTLVESKQQALDELGRLGGRLAIIEVPAVLLFSWNTIEATPLKIGDQEPDKL